MTEVVAVEPDDTLGAMAAERAARSPVPIRPLWSLSGGGCHLNRDTATAIESAGFEVEELDRFSYAPVRLFPAHAHILGIARIRSGDAACQ